MGLEIRPSERADIMHNCQVKVYRNGDILVSAYSSDILRETGWEQRGNRVRDPPLSKDCGDVARSKRRAKQALFDLAYNNDFRYFVTLTLDKSKVDRYDVSEITRKLNHWLDNRVRRNGLAYVLVPERHKDGAIHFHGFFNDALPVQDSGTLSLNGSGKPRKPRSARQRAAWLADGAHVVYNLPGWGLGFSTAIELYGDRQAAVGYVCKYITKADEKIGGRWYYSGGALQRPEVFLTDVDFDQLLAEQGVESFPVSALNCSGLKFWIRECGKNVET